MTQLSELGKIIEAALDRLDRKQSWLAEQMDVSNNAVSKWKKTGQIELQRIELLAKVLGVELSFLLGALLKTDEIEMSDLDRELLILPREVKEQVLEFVAAISGTQKQKIKRAAN